MTKRQDPTTPHLSQALYDTEAPAAGHPAAPYRRPRRRVVRIAAATTAVLAAGALLVGCNKDPEPAPHKVNGEPAPAAGESDGGSKSGGKSGGRDGGNTGGNETGGSETGGSGSQSANSGSGDSSSGKSSSGSSSGSGSDSGSGSQCHTADLKASFGPNHPGAGQENFALVLTNRSSTTCTVRGYPGLAFINSRGEQVSFDPHRTSGQIRTVTLAPGKSAWAPLSFTNPEVTNVTTVTPSAVRVTPPDERASLRTSWSGGPVTNTGKASVPKIGPLAPGTGG
ncbi:DUF4232 domain-containing protein [Streptomyces oryzae]|uniref:DUF4232 domain-containing protein n=1 Tax=Streptomyces oryzae TaxID=1434886 RepID=A0ABS3X9X3_9ACTN|nr:DUF4232 domain-containing protein [Streptomyces oryzae]MBO8192176.1 DUF4232 domain-containing protein [Streptomyces oryzae]